MNVSLPPELEQLVHEMVRTGVYPSATDVVGEGLRLLKERNEYREELRAKIREGIEALDRGEYEEYDDLTTPALASAIKASGRELLNAKR